MSRKEELLAEIEKQRTELNELERKRMRSQSDLVEALIDKVEPNATEVKFFKTLSSLIRLEREQLTSLQEEFDQLK